jgi:hypothetical protein
MPENVHQLLLAPYHFERKHGVLLRNEGENLPAPHGDDDNIHEVNTDMTTATRTTNNIKHPPNLIWKKRRIIIPDPMHYACST